MLAVRQVELGSPLVCRGGNGNRTGSRYWKNCREEDGKIPGERLNFEREAGGDRSSPRSLATAIPAFTQPLHMSSEHTISKVRTPFLFAIGSFELLVE